ncbi:hypothetical protein P3T76_003436 [Phytophthora citrophthora]|uniref:RxLR effector protein n=1 Tax=Phytophthora citrophthora TaxID=4793 RepID=A0AAD9LPH1_9STRA|nr:hypothetical protein P3T76_003436 [Phytophthora citrophthora]
MKLVHTLLVLAAFFVAIGEASISPKQNNDLKLTDSTSQRVLRTAGTPDNNAASEEERGVGTNLASALAKLQGGAKIPLPKAAQFKLWRKSKWNFNRLMAYYGFAGKDKALYENNPIYHRILDYSANYLRKHNINGKFF